AGHAQTYAVDAPCVEAHAAAGRHEPWLELSDLLAAAADVGLAALEALVAIVDAKEGVVRGEAREGVGALRSGHQERQTKEHVRRDALDVTRVQARRVRNVRILRQVARPAVNHAARVATRPEGDVVALEQSHPQTAQGGIPRDTRAVDAATDDHDVHIRLRLLGAHPLRLPRTRGLSELGRRPP